MSTIDVRGIHLRTCATMIAAVAALGLIFGCAKKSVIKKESSVTPSAEGKPVQEEDVEASVRGKDFTPVKELGVIYFDLDQADLREDSRAVAEKNAEFLKAHPSMIVRIDGHCDERGTTEYNLALGQRRAAAIRAYYKSLGIAAKRMATQSLGEERLVCAEQNEDCWGKNRRAETLVRVKEEPAKASPAKTAPAQNKGTKTDSAK
ncbi:MAG: OmpA family protein [Elusimicrobia bacterium]|nr:OmpA family protein [Elusimicrobiota bacterium]